MVLGGKSVGVQTIAQKTPKNPPMDGRGWSHIERNREQKAGSYQELPELVPVAIYLKI